MLYSPTTKSRWTDPRAYVPPIRPTTAERIIIARRVRLAGAVCIAISFSAALYFIGQLARAVAL